MVKIVEQGTWKLSAFKQVGNQRWKQACGTVLCTHEDHLSFSDTLDCHAKLDRRSCYFTTHQPGQEHNPAVGPQLDRRASSSGMCLLLISRALLSTCALRTLAHASPHALQPIKRGYSHSVGQTAYQSAYRRAEATMPREHLSRRPRTREALAYHWALVTSIEGVDSSML